jgi:AGZA family xanthine/uracil permease-like MFS transporter
MKEKKLGFKYPFIGSHDIDGFLGIFTDNLVNMLLIVFLCRNSGLSNSLIFSTILPGAAISVFSGNIFYSHMAKKLALKEKRSDVTALPYGINTVSLIAFHFMIIKPVALATGNPFLAWKVGVAACFISGIIEALGAFIGEKIRKLTPSAALLASIAGVALVFLATEHFVKAWAKPIIVAIPFAIVLVDYFSRVKLPLRLPAGLIALVSGTLVAWFSGAMDASTLSASLGSIGFQVPSFKITQVLEGFSIILPYLSVAVSMGVISFIATIQNLESAKVAGDNYKSFPSMLANGIGTIIGAVFGNPFPTTVYIGHPGWKALGARSGYSVLNGTVMVIVSLTGLMHLISSAIPKEAGYPILIWVGIVMSSQAFGRDFSKYLPAVALGFIPAIASWGSVLLSTFGISYASIISHPTHSGIALLGEGVFISSVLISATCIMLIDKKFLKACFWILPASVFSFFGVIHSPKMGVGAGFKFSIFYLVLAGVFFLIYLKEKYAGDKAEQ